MNISNDSLELILFQRTAYVQDRFLFKLLSKIGRHLPFLHNLTVSLKAKIYADEVKTAFAKDIENDYEQTKQFLPATAEHVLDIGSGMAAIDLFYSRHYGHSVQIHLLDKQQTDKNIYYGFEDKTAFYNSFDAATELLVSNGVPKEHINTHDADDAGSCFDGTRRFDVISSFISWGFHYPLSTYLDAVHEHLADDGVLIIDIRNTTDGLEQLRSRFGSVSEIEKNVSYTRVCVKK